MNETFTNTFRTVSGAVSSVFSAAVSAISKREWIVGSLSEAGEFSFSARPVFHASAASADAEAVRLAKLKPGTVFVTVKFGGGKLVPRVTGVAEF